MTITGAVALDCCSPASAAREGEERHREEVGGELQAITSGESFAECMWFVFVDSEESGLVSAADFVTPQVSTQQEHDAIHTCLATYCPEEVSLSSLNVSVFVESDGDLISSLLGFLEARALARRQQVLFASHKDISGSLHVCALPASLTTSLLCAQCPTCHEMSMIMLHIPQYQVVQRGFNQFAEFLVVIGIGQTSFGVWKR